MNGWREHLGAAWARPVGRSIRPALALAGTTVVALRLVPRAFDDGALAGAIACAVLVATVLVLATVLRAAGIAMVRETPDVERPAAVAIAGLVVVAGPLLVGAPVLAAAERRIGPTWTLLVLLVAVLESARRSRRRAADAPPAATVELSRRSTGALLECRGVEFGYGKLQVLHGVDFSVDEGEMVALLGVNGAGKSTLLRAISGLGMPTAGSIRFDGHDITYLDAERRLRAGINQVPGGRAVFGPLSVVDNLRAYAFTIDPAEATGAIDRALSTFPRLEERRNQQASTLSGGEQQMLALAKAVMLRPKLLLIDELSLGLAPVIVGELLELVRGINADGTAVVLVEQSVNIALGLARHAYFMERGVVRFDGPSAELLDRGDLLRAVFLDGAGGR